MKKKTTKTIKEKAKKKPSSVKALKTKKEKTKPKKVLPKKETAKPKAIKPGRYLEAIGRRKTAVARVRLWTQGGKEFLVNDKPYKDYFSNSETQQIVIDSLKKMKSLDRFKIKVLVKGGGLHAQAEAVRHGISRALVKFNSEFKKRLRRVGFLTRDPRMRERKKFGLKRARRAPQWKKR